MKQQMLILLLSFWDALEAPPNFELLCQSKNDYFLDHVVRSFEKYALIKKYLTKCAVGWVNFFKTLILFVIMFSYEYWVDVAWFWPFFGKFFQSAGSKNDPNLAVLWHKMGLRIGEKIKKSLLKNSHFCGF